MQPNFKTILCPTRKLNLICFPSKADADNYIIYKQQTTDMPSEKGPMNAYYCPACAGWHLTHKLQKNNGDTDGQFNILFKLEQLINDLKSNFEVGDWEIWKTRIDESKIWVAELENDDRCRHLLVEAKRQLVHYDNMVKGKLKKHISKTGRLKNLLNTEIRSVSQKLNTYKVEECEAHVNAMSVLIAGNEWFPLLEKDFQDDCTRIISNLSDEQVITRLTHMGNLLNTVRIGVDMMPTDQLKALHANLVQKMDELAPYRLHKMVVHPFQSAIDLFQKKINARGKDYIDTKTGMDRHLLALQKIFSQCVRLLDEAESRINEGNPIEALNSLQRVDERIRNVPLCKDKIDILQRMIILTSQCL